MNSPIPDRLAALRGAMLQHDVNAVLVPSADPHLSEYLPAHWQARVWLSGFDGSAGTLVVTPESALLWTDSRYFSQAQQQLAGNDIELMKLVVPHAAEHLHWLRRHLRAGNVLSVSGDSIALDTQRQLQEQLAAQGASLRIDLDLPGLVWADRPPLPRSPVLAHDPAYVTTSRAQKLARVRQAVADAGATDHLLSSLDDIAWLLNLRGSDVECNPVFLAHLLLNTTGAATLFVDRDKLDPALIDALLADGVAVAAYAQVNAALQALTGKTRLLLDSGHVASAVAAGIPAGVRVIETANPSTLFKAIKTPGELDHVRQVMRRDGAALVRAFRQLEDRLAAG
ncbi:MAG: aminopeptidase P family N-terminal domain-containing protein, partial [Rhodanobacter sp.]